MTKIFWIVFASVFIKSHFNSFVDGATSVLINHPVGNRVAENTQIVLQCQITEFDSVNNDLAWTRNGQLISYNTNKQQDFLGVDVSLTSFDGIFYYSAKFQMGNVDDSGLYKCLVVQGGPSSYLEITSDTKNLAVIRQSPVCSPSAGDQYLHHNATVTISCSVESVSSRGYPAIYWQRGQMATIGEYTDTEYKRISELHLSAAEDNLDNAIYECVTTSVPQQVCVVGPFHVLASRWPSVSPKTLTVAEGQNAEFSCTVSDPAGASLDWYTTPATPAERTQKTIASSSATVVITNTMVAADNNKMIACRNTIGETGEIFEDSAVLRVLPAPTTAARTTAPPPTTKASTTISPTTTRQTTTVATTTIPTTMTPIMTTKERTTKLMTTLKHTTKLQTTKSPTTNMPIEQQTQQSTAKQAARDSTTQQTTQAETTMNSTSGTLTTRTDKAGALNGFSDAVLIAVGSAGGGFLMLLIIVIVVASLCCCGYCGRNKNANPSGTMKSEASSNHSRNVYTWQNGLFDDDGLPVEPPLSAISSGIGSIRSSTGSYLSDTMRAMPGGYRTTPRQSVKGAPDLFTANGSMRKMKGVFLFDSPNGSINGLHSKVSPAPTREYSHFPAPMNSVNGMPGNLSPHGSMNGLKKTPNNSINGIPGHMTPKGLRHLYSDKKKLIRSASDYAEEPEPYKYNPRPMSIREPEKYPLNSEPYVYKSQPIREPERYPVDPPPPPPQPPQPPPPPVMNYPRNSASEPYVYNPQPSSTRETERYPVDPPPPPPVNPPPPPPVMDYPSDTMEGFPGRKAFDSMDQHIPPAPPSRSSSHKGSYPSRANNTHGRQDSGYHEDLPSIDHLGSQRVRDYLARSDFDGRLPDPKMKDYNNADDMAF